MVRFAAAESSWRCRKSGNTFIFITYPCALDR
jgi:hypothetical protein